MTTLNRSTLRRLLKLPQVPALWEGDRRALPSLNVRDSDLNEQDECVLWVDGCQGVVRAMDIVTPGAGPEIVVPTLLQAMEYPQGAVEPARPQKILVQDREIQFFLRGVLQDLDITVDYAPELPLIQDIFQGLEAAASIEPPRLPPQYADALNEKARLIWQDAPWEFLGDHQIIALELKQWDIDTLYISVMGLLEMEYGLLFYRSLESLRKFRQEMLQDESIEQMETAFLQQDCIFFTFETLQSQDEDVVLSELPWEELQPTFGNLHPLEGLRPFLYDDEAVTLLVVLEALHRFFRQHRAKFTLETFPAITSRYRVPLPSTEEAGPQQIAIKVMTLPELADELLEMTDFAGLEPGNNLLSFPAVTPVVRQDLFPNEFSFSLGMIPWSVVSDLRQASKWYQAGEATPAGDGFPIILLQTSQPKAKTLIEALKSAGGVQTIFFNAGEDPINGDRYDLGILQTGDGNYHLFGEFLEDDPVHIQARKKWDRRCQKTQGWCGLIVARGLKGASRGNPQVRDMLGLFEVRSRSAQEMGLGPLQMMPQFDFE